MGPSPNPLFFSDPRFRLNLETNIRLARDLAERRDQVMQMGPHRDRDRHVARGKLLVRDRIREVLDVESPFLELSTLAAWGQYGNSVPSAGVVTGIGRIHSRPVMVMANDATVKGGTYYPLGVQKQLRALEIAVRHTIPCLFLVDSGGAFLPLQAQIFPDVSHGGRFFYLQAKLSSMRVPQIAVVMGPCTAGGAYAPAMCEQVIIVKNSGAIFLAGPPLVKAATGEIVTVEELGGGDVHTRISGVADELADDEAESLQRVRDFFESVPQRTIDISAQATGLSQASSDSRPADFGSRLQSCLPHPDHEALLGLLPVSTTSRFQHGEIIVRLVDQGGWNPVVETRGFTAGRALLGGMRAGVVAFSGTLDANDFGQAGAFLEYCDGANLPLILIHDLDPPGPESGQVGPAGRWLRSLWKSPQPRLILGIGACSSPTSFLGGDFSGHAGFSWYTPNARPSFGAAGSVSEVGDPFQAVLESTSRVWDDGILSPLEIRDTLIRALEVVRPLAPLGMGRTGN